MRLRSSWTLPQKTTTHQVREWTYLSGRASCCSIHEIDPQGAILFLHRVLESGAAFSMLSVRSSSRANLTGRAIVTHLGDSLSGGVWSCSKDSGGASCSHISLAKVSFQQAISPSTEPQEGVEQGVSLVSNPRGMAELGGCLHQFSPLNL
jgi:hypothetical protein